METKKHPSKNLERKRLTFFQIGILFALCFTFIAFEWKSHYVPKVFDKSIPLEAAEFEFPPLIFEKKVELPLPKKLEMPKIISSEVKEVPDETEVETNEKLDLIIPDVPFKPDFTEEPEPVIPFPDVYPEFPGGVKKLYEYLEKNTIYPKMAKEAGIKGTVHISFVVGKDGKIRDIEILRGIKGLDEEALRVIMNMPDWIPGKQKGKDVAVKYNVPLIFNLK